MIRDSFIQLKYGRFNSRRCKNILCHLRCCETGFYEILESLLQTLFNHHSEDTGKIRNIFKQWIDLYKKCQVLCSFIAIRRVKKFLKICRKTNEVTLNKESPPMGGLL